VRRNINNQETWQIYGIDGELVAEYAASGAVATPQKEYGYRGGQLLITAEPAATQNVSWTNTVGVTANGNSLTKTAATAWGNAGASSTQSVAAGDAYVEVTASETNTARLFGFSHTDADQNWPSINFGIDLDLSGLIYVFESGNNRGSFGSYATGDKFQVAIVGGVVKYKKNGTVFYTSSVAPTYPLVVDTALNATGCTLSNVVLNAPRLNWLVSDHLGTPRIILDQTGTLANLKRHDYLPFGEELSAGTGGRISSMGYVSGDGVRQQFTDKERDSETGLDYLGARYYASAQGRFTSADSYSGRSVNPQTLNLYTYVRNNPLKYVDPTGHQDENPRKKGKKGNDDPGEEFLNTEDTPGILEINSVPGIGPPPPPPVESTINRLNRMSLRVDSFIIKQSLRLASGGPILVAAEALLPQEWIDTWHSPGVQIPLMMSVVGSPLAIEAEAEEVTAAMEGELDALIDETLVVRGGQCLIENFQKPGEINAAGLLDGASVNSKAGVSLEELSRGIPNNQIGVTTVSKIEAAGGTVKATPSKQNPYHADLGGITAEKAHELFTPTRRNPNKP